MVISQFPFPVDVVAAPYSRVLFTTCSRRLALSGHPLLHGGRAGLAQSVVLLCAIIVGVSIKPAVS